MIKLKTAISLLVMMALFSFTSNQQNDTKVTNQSSDNSSELLKKAIKSNKGQLVLISFWASYDASSRIENIKCANLMKTFQNEKYNDAIGFSVISVSLDRFNSVFHETIKRDGLQSLTNIFVNNGLESNLAKNYKLDAKFGNLLLDANGRVIGRNLSSEELRKTLEAKLSN
jgi:thiol-disulfide isomerase/thioredoxin